MASVYTNDLRLEEIGSGEQSGTWGDTTNTNLELIAEAFSFGTEAITTNADTHATTIADGATDAGRSMFLKYTGTLDSACTITIGPNTVSKLWFIENGTSGSQNIIIKQGSGATITIPAGQTKAIYSNGAGSGGAMVDAFATLNVVDLLVDDDLAVTGVLTTTAATVFNGGFTANVASTISTDGNEDTLVLKSNDADANSGPKLQFNRNSANPADGDDLGEIRFSGRNDAGQAVEYLKIYTEIIDASDGTEDGRFTIDTMLAGTSVDRMQFNSAETIFNQDSVDLDFRVESNNDANAFFVEGSTGNIGIGIAAPAGDFHLTDASDIRILFTSDQTGNTASDGTFIGLTDGGNFNIFNREATNIKMYTSGVERLNIAADGAISTLTAGTSNVRLGVNAGDSIASGGNYNVCVGDEAGTAITIGDFNTAVGFAALKSNTNLNSNVAIGAEALFTNTEGAKATAVGTAALYTQNPSSDVNTHNVAVGFEAGKLVSTGTLNTFVGALAGDGTDDGEGNTAVGYLALSANCGDHNTAVGSGSLTSAIGSQNTAVGENSGKLSVGTRNVFVGVDAGELATSTDDCVMIGHSAGGGATLTGHDNVLIGKEAGHDLTSGAGNVFIGREAGDKTDDAATSVVIGHQAGGANFGSNMTAVGAGAAAISTVATTAFGKNASNASTVSVANTAIGNSALAINVGAQLVTAVGSNALDTLNTSNANNRSTAVGYLAGGDATTASNLTLLGGQAGENITTGGSNLCVGRSAGDVIQTGANNTILGTLCDPSAENAAHQIVIGNSIAGTEDNQFSFGKASNVVSNNFATNASFSRSSDVHKKTNIENDTLGLDFINDLRTVTFNWKPNTEFPEHYSDYHPTVSKMKTEVKLHGMIAQEVKAALDNQGVDTFGGWAEEKDGSQRISQEMFVHPLIKAVQELSSQVDGLKAEIKELKNGN